MVNKTMKELHDDNIELVKDREIVKKDMVKLYAENIKLKNRLQLIKAQADVGFV